MVRSEAEIAQALDVLAAPQVVDCVECGAPIVLTRWARLYCSERCRQILKFVHYGRAVVADGRIERDPTIEKALQMRLAHILAGGYHERRRRVPLAMRASIFERDGGKCVLCGAAATQVDHIAGDANTPENLRAACGACNLGLAQARLVPASHKQADVADLLLDRVSTPAPLYPRDDAGIWAATSTRLLAERRVQVRAHLAVAKLLQKAAASVRVVEVDPEMGNIPRGVRNLE